MRSQNREHHRPKRSAAALVEMAIVLPIVLLMLAAFLELSRVSMLKHTAEAAAYEGARVGIVAGATPADARTASEAMLRATGIKQWQITVEPSRFLESTANVRVTVQLPIEPNTWIPPFFYKRSQVGGSVILITERPPAIQLSGIDEQQGGLLGVSALGIGL